MFVASFPDLIPRPLTPMGQGCWSGIVIRRKIAMLLFSILPSFVYVHVYMMAVFVDVQVTV